MRCYGHWLSELEIDEEAFFGFIYLIVNTTNNKKYIGKKQFYQYRNRKKWKKFDWQNYTSSSKSLNEDIKSLGKDSFAFYILFLCKTRGELTYLEANEQHKRDVLVSKLDSGEREYYNKSIAGIKFLPILSHTEASKKKISEGSSKMVRNTSGLAKESRTPEGRVRRSKSMQLLNESNLSYVPKPRTHLIKFKDGSEFVCEDWISWAKLSGYSVNTLESLRKGRGRCARQNKKSSDKDVVYIQPLE